MPKLTGYEAEVWPVLDAIVANPSELFAVRVLADKLDDLNRPQTAAELRKWKENEQPWARHSGLIASSAARTFYIMHSVRSWWIELWCLLIEAATEVPIEFGYSAGGAVLRHGGGRKGSKRVRAAALRLRPLIEHWYFHDESNPPDREFFPGHWVK